MTILDVMKHEWQTKLSQPSARISLGLFTLMLVYSAMSGGNTRNNRLRAIANHDSETSEALEAWQNDLIALEEKGAESGVPLWAGSPMDVNFPTALPPAPLGDFAVGQSDLLPYLGSVSLWNPHIRLFSKYEFEDPVALTLGEFDLSKTLTLILPLLLIVLCFDCLSAERDQDRLNLIFAQGINIRWFFWARFIVRALVVLGLVLLVSSLAFWFGKNATPLAKRWPFFALWLFMSLLYGAFWMAIISLAASINRSSEANLLLLLLFWAGIILILPGSITAVTEAFFPTPSRATYLAQAREVENETERSEAAIANQYLIDHPEMSLDRTSVIPDYVRTAFLVTQNVDDATRPILNAFEETIRRRELALGRLCILSPAMIATTLFNDVTGTSSARHRQYMAEARSMKAGFADQVEPYVMAGERLPVALLTDLPQFQFDALTVMPILKRNGGSLIFMAGITLLLFFFANRNLARMIGPFP